MPNSDSQIRQTKSGTQKICLIELRGTDIHGRCARSSLIALRLGRLALVQSNLWRIGRWRLRHCAIGSEGGRSYCAHHSITRANRRRPTRPGKGAIRRGLAHGRLRIALAEVTNRIIACCRSGPTSCRTGRPIGVKTIRASVSRSVITRRRSSRVICSLSRRVANQLRSRRCFASYVRRIRRLLSVAAIIQNVRCGRGGGRLGRISNGLSGSI